MVAASSKELDGCAAVVVGGGGGTSIDGGDSTANSNSVRP